MKRTFNPVRAAVVAMIVALGACGGEAVVETESLVGADDAVSLTSELSTSVPVGSTLKATANVNMRKGAGTGYGVILVVPKGATVTTVERTSPSNGFYKIKYNGKTGWSHGNYYTLVSTPSGSTSGSLAVGTSLRATANVNLRSGASTSYSVLRVVPNGATVVTVSAEQSNGYYKIRYDGTVGWSYGTYYTRVSSGSSSGSGSTNTSQRDLAIRKAQAGVGFSYWWGHGRFRMEGPTSSTRGSCTGSCPSCSHSGSYGADCSGFVAKTWAVGSNNSDVSVDRHPYSTYHFTHERHGWHTVSRSSLRKADALTYNSNGSGHIILYESGDGWGSLWAYEAKGCSYGIVRNLRTVSSSYKAIARDNW
ncbi:MAG: SH3 domain-containing protein [Myxococcales bacterium]|jgi:uncharacterized protein YgiM (DUF1202 family)